MAGLAIGVGGCMQRCLRGWECKAAGVVDLRETLETSREWLRLTLRAWREVTDGVPAHAAAFAQRWRRGEAKLAARLTFTPGGAAGRLNTMARSPPMALLAYMRLVRAGAVRATRRQSGPWLRTREDWGMGLARVHHEGHEPRSFADPRVHADLRARERLESMRGCTAGASAVMVQRGRQRKTRARDGGAEELWRRAHAQRTQRRQSAHQAHGTPDRAAAAAAMTPIDDGTPAVDLCDTARGAEQGAHGAAGGRKYDGVLFLRTTAFAALEAQLQCERWRAQLGGRLRAARRKRGEG